MKILFRKVRDKFVRAIINPIFYYGRARWCPVCGCYSRKFGKSGIKSRDDARCMRCGSLERHRLVLRYFERETDLFTKPPRKMLHVAPEKCLSALIHKRVGPGYISADLSGVKAMVKMDITNINYPDEYFDVIYCSHVLEHVEKDRQAMQELNRVLKSDGWAILLVPITVEKTYEDFSITNPMERTRTFGHPEHVRRYGHDYVDRLQSAGFKVRTTRVADFLSPQEIEKMGLTNRAAGEIFYCTKSNPRFPQ
ncbi:MAG TPA: methyltransferase domain-containing protein [Gammaproteobacteria bacterium]